MSTSLACRHRFESEINLLHRDLRQSQSVDARTDAEPVRATVSSHPPYPLFRSPANSYRRSVARCFASPSCRRGAGIIFARLDVVLVEAPAQSIPTDIKAGSLHGYQGEMVICLTTAQASHPSPRKPPCPHVLMEKLDLVHLNAPSSPSRTPKWSGTAMAPSFPDGLPARARAE